MRKLMIGFAVALTLAGGALISSMSVDAAATSVDVTITGQNYGLIATLAKDEAANAIEAAAQLNALKVTSAKGADGKEMADLKGKTVHYLPTKSAADLMLGDKHQGKNVEVKGKLFKAEGVLIVGEFKEAAAAAGNDDFDDLPTKTLTRQQVL